MSLPICFSMNRTSLPDMFDMLLLILGTDPLVLSMLDKLGWLIPSIPCSFKHEWWIWINQREPRIGFNWPIRDKEGDKSLKLAWRAAIAFMAPCGVLGNFRPRPRNRHFYQLCYNSIREAIKYWGIICSFPWKKMRVLHTLQAASSC